MGKLRGVTQPCHLHTQLSQLAPPMLISKPINVHRFPGRFQNDSRKHPTPYRQGLKLAIDFFFSPPSPPSKSLQGYSTKIVCTISHSTTTASSLVAPMLDASASCSLSPLPVVEAPVNASSAPFSYNAAVNPTPICLVCCVCIQASHHTAVRFSRRNNSHRARGRDTKY